MATVYRSREVGSGNVVKHNWRNCVREEEEFLRVDGARVYVRRAAKHLGWTVLESLWWADWSVKSQAVKGAAEGEGAGGLG